MSGAPRLSSDKTAVVAPEFHWLLIDEHTPRGVKMLLINKRAGVAHIGAFYGADPFYTHWAPLPTWKKDAAPLVEEVAEGTVDIPHGSG